MNLTDPGTLRALLRKHGFEAAKGLGQHFLVSSKAVNAIVGAFDGCGGILEIGPGPGVLTQPLSADRPLIALDLDARLPALLTESAPRAELRLIDALEADLAALAAELPSPVGLVSNLPYYITGPLLGRIADARASLDRAVLMMQKEVALRVLAAPRTPERGGLSVAMQTQFDVSLVTHVPGGAFLPPPKVDSTVLRFLPRPILPREAAFLKFLKLGFTQPRKTLANNLAAGLGRPREEILATLDGEGLGDRARPQELTNEAWRSLWERLDPGPGSP